MTRTGIEKLRSIINAGRKKVKIEYRFLCADGSYRTVLDRAFILFDGKGQAVRMIGSMQDITERMNHLEKIETQNAKLKEISWIQAHKVRAPLSSILGLANLVSDTKLDASEIQEIVRHIGVAANELDAVLREITSKT